MGNAQKPTSRTRHIDIKYFALYEWIERNLIHLERIDTAVNTADHLTKTLLQILFHRHADYLLGHIPDLDNKPVQYVLYSFTTPTTAKAHRMLMPTTMDLAGNPWLPIIIWNEDYNL